MSPRPKSVDAFARSIRLLLSIFVAVGLAGCQSQGDRQREAEHADHGAEPTPAPNLPYCKAGPIPDLKMKARKDRIAKGVFRASRRTAVDGELELWDTPYGPYWVVADNFESMSEILGEQAVEIYGDKDSGVREGDVVLDCGAHFGGFTRTALNRGAKLVVAIEIAPENVAALRKNFAAEIASGRVIVYDKGVWDKEESMVLVRKNHTWADQVAETGPGPHVAVTTVDNIVSELRLSKVDFIKMDIEGAERNAMAGASGTLKTFRPRMAIAAYHRPDDVQVLSALATSARSDYTTCLSGGGLGHGYTTLLCR